MMIEVAALRIAIQIKNMPGFFRNYLSFCAKLRGVGKKKIADRMTYVMDATRITEEQIGRVQELSVAAFRATECEGMARADCFVRSDGEDKVATNVAYLTAWWTPSIARLPHTTEVKIDAPEDWHVVSEGLSNGPRSFRCDVPISYPKVMGGLYRLAAEAKDPKGRTFQAYHLDPVQPERGKRDVALMLEAVEFFEKTLGDWPFPGYTCYDADTYYGIESYSHTLLRRNITTTFVTHEMGHTYFGGLVPSAYVWDSWNEGLTQYIDSVVFRNNRDGTFSELVSGDLKVGDQLVTGVILPVDSGYLAR